MISAVFASWLLAAAPDAAAAPAPVPVPCSDPKAASRVDAVLMRGNRAGFQTVCALPDGTLDVTFAFNDRGRGPELRSRLVPGAGSVLASVTTDGHEYLRAAVSERFTLRDGAASWKNRVEEGSRPPGPPAFYVSFDSVPEETVLLARALLAAPGGRLPLLPAGEARIEAAGERTIEVAGAPHKLTHYEISGLGFQPVDLWLEEGGGRSAAVSQWFTVVPEGWEAAAPVLLEEQEKRAAARRAGQAKRLRHVPAGPVAIVHADLFDSPRARMLPGTTVVVERGVVSAVGRDGTVKVPKDAAVVDAAGRALLPGLWDMHAHPDLDDGILHLACGVTGIRDMAAEPEASKRFRAWETGEAVGPNVVFAGIVDGRGPYQGPTQVLISSEAEGRAAVRDMAKAGFNQVKIYSSVRPEWVAGIAAEAHGLGLRVSGHVPAFMTAEQAILAGYDEIQHMNMLFLNFMADKVQDTRTPARFTVVGDNAGSLDLASKPVTDFVALLKSRRIVVDSTLDVFSGMFLDRPGTISGNFAAVADRMPPSVRRGFLGGGLPVPDAATDARYRAAYAAMQKMLGMLHRAGVTLVAGTDDLAGFALPRELELYVEAGIPAAKVLQMATFDAARIARRGSSTGSIERGKWADMILVDGDPTKSIGDVRRVRLVSRGTAFYDPDELDREIGVLPLPGASPVPLPAGAR